MLNKEKIKKLNQEVISNNLLLQLKQYGRVEETEVLGNRVIIFPRFVKAYGQIFGGLNTNLCIIVDEKWEQLPKECREATVLHEVGHIKTNTLTTDPNEVAKRVCFFGSRKSIKKELAADLYAINILGGKAVYSMIEAIKAEIINLQGGLTFAQKREINARLKQAKKYL